ncbi:N-acetyltransferase ats1 [Fusarium albosuccineum]|uniref:N-acetyltransferase ats1 n=1 Tax=Fusarium albosuccineum TaxID=1237068 RepID=A0A8H4LFH3_9HYPO|nr:N-acetyltransferase ats1 [Fusarium albosuccineum]
MYLLTSLFANADVPTIIKFMHESAAEQNAPASAKATEQDLVAAIDFGDPQASAERGPRGRFAKLILAVAPEGPVAGMATYFVTFAFFLGRSSVCLEDLFVLPEYRRRGYARDLVQAIARETTALGCARMEWQCYKENDRALRFYQSLGAKVMDPIAYLRLDEEGLVKLANDGD